MKLFLSIFLLSISSFCYLTTAPELTKEVTVVFSAEQLIQMPELDQEQPELMDGMSYRTLCFKSRTSVRKSFYSTKKCLSSGLPYFSLFSIRTHSLTGYSGFLARLYFKGFYLYYFQKLTV